MADGRDAHDDELITAVGATVAAGPTTLTELAATLRDHAAFADLGADPEDQLEEVARLVQLHDDLWIGPGEVVVRIDHLVGSLVLTHRITTDDLERGMLDADPDLEVLDRDRIGPLDVDGAPLERLFPDEFDAAGPDGSFMGPSGWLDGFRPGDLVALRRNGAHVAVERVATLGEGDAEVAALRRAFDGRGLASGVGELIEVVVLDALVTTPGLFRTPVAPIGELLATAGLSCQREWTGAAGEEWVPAYLAAAQSEYELVADRYLLDECCLDSLDDAMDAWNAFLLGAEEDELPANALAQALGHGWVAPAFADLVLGGDEQPRAELDRFAGLLVIASSKPAKAIGLYLLARNLERSGDGLAVEAALETSARLDPQFEPALEDLAWHAADRGDVDKAINLLRRAGAEVDDPQLQMLEAMRPARNVVGRNERCPCGSGRKYKDCCQRTAVRPLRERAPWLEHKLWTFSLRPHRQHLPLLLTARLSPKDDDELDAILASGLPMDLAAFELGLAEVFLAERGSLLPGDERELLEVWLRQPRELWEVVERVSSSTVVARRASTAELVSVSGLDEGQPGDVFLARVAPIDDVARVVGVALRVPPELRSSAEALVASGPDAYAIASWIADANVMVFDQAVNEP